MSRAVATIHVIFMCTPGCGLKYSRDSASVVEARGLDPQCTQIHKALAAVMNLVVDGVENQVVERRGVLAECCSGGREVVAGQRLPVLVDLASACIPDPQE